MRPATYVRPLTIASGALLGELVLDHVSAVPPVVRTFSLWKFRPQRAVVAGQRLKLTAQGFGSS